MDDRLLGRKYSNLIIQTDGTEWSRTVTYEDTAVSFPPPDGMKVLNIYVDADYNLVVEFVK